MRHLIALAVSATMLAACSQEQAAPVETGTDGDMPADAVQTPAADGSPADPAPDAATGSDVPEADEVEEPSAFAQTFPQAIRGKWRETDGNAPTATECNATADGNIGKVLEIREDGWSIFENGGRFIWVTDRSEGRIRAVFDTTYADTPTQADIAFAVDPVAKTLTMRYFAPAGNETITYRRCPRGS